MRGLTTGQAAAEIGVHRETIVRWIDQGLLPAVRTPGGRRLVDPKDVAGVLTPVLARQRDEEAG